MSRNMNPITVCCAAVLMLGLAACGSDDDGSATMMEAPTPVAVSLSGVEDDAKRTAGTAEIAAGESADTGEVTFTCAAGGDACSVTVDADGDATATGGTVTAANSAAYTTRVVATDAAKTKFTAMDEEAKQGETDQPVDAGLGGSNTDGTAVDTYSIDISRSSTGTTIEITDTALAGEDDPEFTLAEDLMDGRIMHVRSKAADDEGNVEQEVVLVATDIDPPTPMAFAMVPGQDLDDRDLDNTVDADGDGTNTNDYTALAVDQSSMDVLRLVSSDDFAPGPGSSTSLTFDADDAGTADTDEAYEAAGTYNGAMGTYRCNGSNDCTVTIDADGDISAMSDGWVFTPDAGATSIVADSDYLHYGFWLKRTRDSDGAVTAYDEVETFAGSSVAASGPVTAVEGTASYEGGAVGVYAIRNAYDPDTGELDDATSGHFKADASLKAYFSGTSVAEDDYNSITGTINNFALSGGEVNDWSVKLEGAIAPSDGTASGTAAGGGTERSFSATFHGSVARQDDGTVPQPGSVVGEFNADFSNGAVAGAFGATKRPEAE